MVHSTPRRLSSFVGALFGAVELRHQVVGIDAVARKPIRVVVCNPEEVRAGKTWKAYLEGMPYPGYRGYCYPDKCNGLPDSDTRYVAKTR
jgi:hypothetical protein